MALSLRSGVSDDCKAVFFPRPGAENPLGKDVRMMFDLKQIPMGKKLAKNTAFAIMESRNRHDV
ncbi:hypothetical protein [Neisseria sp. CCUG12390]|uniref:hypothetical protein n=1 Tax=Neisseria sp. CCUG12390 TaxID=3392035 RepID=UPI003A1028EB